MCVYVCVCVCVQRNGLPDSPVGPAQWALHSGVRGAPAAGALGRLLPAGHSARVRQ